MLHFDINNTILMADKAKNISCLENVSRTSANDGQVHRIVCKSAWGRMSGTGEQLNWQLAHD